jgi:glutathione S-transferase
MAIVRHQDFRVELREVFLKKKPEQLLECSGKGTVPVLVLRRGIGEEKTTVIEESLEIMQYVSGWTLSKEEENWIKRNDTTFKFHLDRYKYPYRYKDENIDPQEQRQAGYAYLKALDNRLGSESEPKISVSLSDALFPFVRQFANTDRDWFDAQHFENLHQWLKENLESSAFKACMKNYKKPWVEGDEVTFFPS